jgi:tetratricopeptide (TPR) repeat protein
MKAALPLVLGLVGGVLGGLLVLVLQFEELLEIQKRQSPEPYFASTYFRLGTLYKDAGNLEKARQTWNEGLRLFPDNEELKGTIEASTKK